MTLQKPRTPTAAVPDAVPEFGSRELEGYKVQLNVVLKVGLAAPLFPACFQSA
jgi:hypothetical protein